jgi:CobQ-like glutamine amidotransferase family enzyme
VSGLGLTIFHLYPAEMNLYGDTGNVLALSRRCEWRGISARVVELPPGGSVDFADADLLFLGGGQDRGQEVIAEDLVGRGAEIRDAVEDGLPALLVCGGYQLFGDYFETIGGVRLPGIGVFDAHTVGGKERLIGNVVVDASALAAEQDVHGGFAFREPRERILVGFENHSGRTYLGESARPLGTIVHGRGNDGTGRTEGAVYGNAIGTYLHGSLLPKNPWLADLLILKALQRRNGEPAELAPLDDTAEYAAQRRGAERASESRMRRLLRR